ncbi:MAG: 2-dehydro-3-deoxygalactonokinase [Litoreibacter sp.]
MSGSSTYAAWIAVDWGTSNLRAWAMSDTNGVLDMVTSDKGMMDLERSEFEPHLLSLIEPWLGGETTRVIACGMIGARQGWAEVPYRKVPTIPTSDLHSITCEDSRLLVQILPGLKQLKHADVMRGEETQIAGFLAGNQNFDGVICLPGTHTKWAHISAGEVVSFQTFMTGELFDLLSCQSILRHSVGTREDWSDAAFAEAVGDALSRPAALGANLFQLRASDLLEGRTLAANRARMSGLLIGMELAAAKPYWLGQEIALVGEPHLNDLYASALTAQGLAPSKHIGDEQTLRGLIAAYQESNL